MSAPWTKEEEMELEALAGDYPWSMVVERHNQWSLSKGRLPRSSLALARRSNVIGAGRVPEGEWLTIGAVSTILGIDREKPRRWIRSGKIQAKRECTKAPSPHYVSRQSLRDWAKRDPAFFRPYARDALVLLFDSERIADQVYKHPPINARAHKRPVRCVETGEIFKIRPEYIAVSKGFGSRWFEAYKSDCYPSDFLTHEGRKFSVPKYYDKLLERTDPKALRTYKARRIARSKRDQANQTPERLAVREIVKQSQINTLKRKL